MIPLTPTDARPAFQAKLAEVTSCVRELRDVEQPRLTPRMDGWEIVARLLATARAIYQMAETLVESRPGTDFDALYGAWLASLTEPQRELWQQMRAAGGEQLHGESAELFAVKVTIPWEPAAETFHGVPGVARPESYKPVPRFRRYPGRPASDVCADYFALCQLFVDEIRRLS
jgi:hypothetical protein